MGRGQRRVLVAAMAAAVALAVAPVAESAAEPGPTSTWVVTTSDGAKVEVEVDGRRIGPHDIAVQATAADAQALASTPGVVAVERDEPALGADLPLDPCLLGPGCPVPADQRALRRIGVETAWSVTGAAPDVVVAVVDGGVDVTHPDLAGRVTAVAPGADGCAALPVALGTNDRTSTGHGTRIAGLLAAVGDESGIAGVAFGGIAVRSYTALGPDLRGSTADVAAAIHCAIDDGVDIVNLSLTTGDTTAMRNALDRAEAAGVVVVAAAGNGGEGAHPGVYPAAHPTVLGVTSVTNGIGDEARAPFANGGAWVDLAAPGVEIVSTAPGGGWSVADGTSYSSPFVAGAAALVLGRAPDLTPALVRARLTGTAEPIGDGTVGRGLVDVSAAVRFAVPDAAPCATGSAWLLDAFGGLHALGGAPPVGARAYWPDWDIARDLAVVATRDGGYLLDGFGALHPFGGAPPVPSPAYRSGWDIARAADRRVDGSVVVLDGQGGIHVAGAGPDIGAGGPWWPGTDTARDIAVEPYDSTRAYVLDAWGGVHLAGAGTPAPPVEVTHYTPGRDLARRLVVLPEGRRGYVLDARGALHPWAVVGVTLPPPAAAATSVAGTAGRGIATTADGALLTVTGSGAIVATGDQPCAAAPLWPGQDLARAIVPVP